MENNNEMRFLIAIDGQPQVNTTYTKQGAIDVADSMQENTESKIEVIEFLDGKFYQVDRNADKVNKEINMDTIIEKELELVRLKAEAKALADKAKEIEKEIADDKHAVALKMKAAGKKKVISEDSTAVITYKESTRLSATDKAALARLFVDPALNGYIINAVTQKIDVTKLKAEQPEVYKEVAVTTETISIERLDEE